MSPTARGGAGVGEVRVTGRQVRMYVVQPVRVPGGPERRRGRGGAQEEQERMRPGQTHAGAGREGERGLSPEELKRRREEEMFRERERDEMRDEEL
ncbi:hypothetical protein [Streptomyces virginiae]|uniref:hypothetical protein n=1 Tax=Streptomyces virginiae TaxID=1961 RepID=UPI0036C304DD